MTTTNTMDAQQLVNQWQAAWVSTQDISRDSEADLVRRIEAAIFTRHLAPIREALEGVVAAFDNNDGDPEVRRVTQECAIAGAKHVLGWDAAATTSPKQKTIVHVPLDDEEAAALRTQEGEGK